MSAAQLLMLALLAGTLSVASAPPAALTIFA